MTREAIRVDGLSEFRRNLKKLDKDLPKAVRLAFNEAADLVVDQAVTKYPHRTGRAKGSVKARSTQKFARVKAGSKRAPYTPWLEFGGKVGKNRSVVRPFRKKGYYLYPAYHKLKDSGEFQKTMNKALIKVAKQAGVEVD